MRSTPQVLAEGFHVRGAFPFAEGQSIYYQFLIRTHMLTVLIDYPQFLWGQGVGQVSDTLTVTQYHAAGPKTLRLCYEQSIS